MFETDILGLLCFRKILDKKSDEKRCNRKLCVAKNQTPHAKLANATRGDDKFRTRSSPLPQAEFGEISRRIYLRKALDLYFLCPALQNASLQTLYYKGKLDLSPYFAFGVAKCHRSKNKRSESVSLGIIFTNLPY